MPVLLLPIFNILKSYWKPLGVVLIITLILGITYEKGRIDCSRKVAEKTAQELEKRHNAAEKEQEKDTKIDQQIEHSRKQDPHNDKRDGCLLSSDPYTKGCL